MSQFFQDSPEKRWPVEQRTRDAATVVIERAAAAYAAVPGVVSTHEGDDLLIEGRGLSRRWLTDARIRFGHWSAR